MGDRGYRGQLGIVVPASKKAKVSKEVQQLEDEKQRGHELQAERAAIECMNERVKEWAVVSGVWNGQEGVGRLLRLGDARSVCADQPSSLRSSHQVSLSPQRKSQLCIINAHGSACFAACLSVAAIKCSLLFM